MGGRFHYDRDSLREALFAVGVVPGDIVFCHAGLLKLGLPRELAAGTDAVTLPQASAEPYASPDAEGTTLPLETAEQTTQTEQTPETSPEETPEQNG